MTVVAGVENYTLTDQAWGQLEACGIALSELYRLLRYPKLSLPGLEPGETRYNGYGLTAIVQATTVVAIEIDGADGVNWSDWAVERAVFGDSDVAAADDLVRADLAPQGSGSDLFTSSCTPVPEQRKSPAQIEAERRMLLRRLAVGTQDGPVRARPRPKPIAADPAPCEVAVREVMEGYRPNWGDTNVLSRIHPLLHAEITRRVDGDWSRLTIYSPTVVFVDLLPEDFEE